MTQTQHTPAPSPSQAIAWSQALQTKLMAALDDAWAILEHCDDPAEIKRVRDKARAIGELAAQARKVALITPKEPKADANVAAKAEMLARVMAPGLAAEAPGSRPRPRRRPGRALPPSAGKAERRRAGAAVRRSKTPLIPANAGTQMEWLWG